MWWCVPYIPPKYTGNLNRRIMVCAGPGINVNAIQKIPKSKRAGDV
jgi:hypothetical protein